MTNSNIYNIPTKENTNIINSIFNSISKVYTKGKTIKGTSDQFEFAKRIVSSSTSDKSINVYIPKSCTSRQISHIRYLMKGAYPNLENISFLGKLATINNAELSIYQHGTWITKNDLKIREKHVQYLTGWDNINLLSGNTQSLVDNLPKQSETNMFALSLHNKSIFEMPCENHESIIDALPHLNVPLLVF